MKLLIKPLIIISSFAVFACNNSNSGSTGSGDSATTKTDSMKTDSATAMQSTPTAEQNFVNYAVPGNTKEIIWLEAGVKDGHSKELRDHAKMMWKDHKKLGEAVGAYLSSHSALTAPTVDTANVVNIQDKKGKDWDKAWTDKMVDDHSELLSKLKQSQNDVKDTALSSIINGAIPVVESHLAMVKTLQNKMK